MKYHPIPMEKTKDGIITDLEAENAQLKEELRTERKISGCIMAILLAIIAIILCAQLVVCSIKSEAVNTTQITTASLEN